jgi:hypothetical protein
VSRLVRALSAVALLIALTYAVLGVITRNSPLLVNIPLWLILAATWYIGVRPRPLVLRRSPAVAPDAILDGAWSVVLGQLATYSGPARVVMIVHLTKSSPRSQYRITLEGDQALGHATKVLDPMQDLGWITASSRVEVQLFGLGAEVQLRPRPSDAEIATAAVRGGAR